MTSRTAQRRASAQRARLELAAAQQRAASRRRARNAALAALVAAVAVVAVAIASGHGSTRSTAANGGRVAGAAAVTALLDGIPQHGVLLGRGDAPVHVVEFADLQCPYCDEFSVQALPQLIQTFVRAGEVSFAFRNLSFIGPDSVRAGRVAAGAEQQNRLWNFVELMYLNQGEENTGYATDAYLHRPPDRDPGPRRRAGRAREPLTAVRHGTCGGQRRRRGERCQLDAVVPHRARRRADAAVPAGKPHRGRLHIRAQRTHRGGKVSDDILRRAIGGLTALGLGVAGYLTYVHYAGLRPVCGISHGCETVQTSQYAFLGGVPVALLGLITYTIVMATVFSRSEEAMLVQLVLVLIAFSFSAYLSYREVFTIHAICSWCASSAIIFTILAGLVTARVLVRRPDGGPRNAMATAPDGAA